MAGDSEGKVERSAQASTTDSSSYWWLKAILAFVLLFVGFFAGRLTTDSSHTKTENILGRESSNMTIGHKVRVLTYKSSRDQRSSI